MKFIMVAPKVPGAWDTIWIHIASEANSLSSNEQSVPLLLGIAKCPENMLLQDYSRPASCFRCLRPTLPSHSSQALSTSYKFLSYPEGHKISACHSPSPKLPRLW